MSTTSPEYLTTLRTGLAEAVQQWADQSTSAWEQWTRAWQPVADAGADALGMPRLDLGSPPRVSRGPGAGKGSRWGCGCGCGEGDHGCREHHRGGHGGHHEHAYDHGEHAHDHPAHEHAAHDHPGHHHHGHQAGCGCGCDERSRGCCDSHCDCCVPDADVVVHARAGEVRVVPFRLHNPWRREREVTLEVGPWHACGGDAVEVRGRLEESSLTLAPCEDRVVRLLVTAAAPRADSTRHDALDDPADTPAVDKPGADKAAAAKAARANRAGTVQDVAEEAVARRLGDVDCCTSAYADVRFEGCARPQRVALVVLPADCDAVDVGCGCGCCEEHR